MSLLIGLYIDEGLQHSLHKLILGGDQLFKVDIIVGDVVVVVGLAIALAIPFLCNPTICTRDRGKILPFYLS
jgi:hypothetical protein